MKRLFLVGLCVCLLAAAGCAGLTMNGAAFDLNTVAPGEAKNSQVAATTSETKDAWGQNSRVTDTWQVQNGVWVRVSTHQASGAGIGQTTVTAVGGSAPTAIALPVAARLIRPSSTNVSQNNQGGNANQGQGQGQVGTNTQAQGQLQGQAQGQLQGQQQGQNQGQTTGAFSPNTVF